jgi:hypothetical protein
VKLTPTAIPKTKKKADIIPANLAFDFSAALKVIRLKYDAKTLTREHTSC